MKRHAIAIVLVMLATGSQARIEAPDHVIYGNATVFGEPAAPGQVVRIRLLATGEVISEYELGREERLGDQFSLRIPMDSVDPRLEGRARPGDPINIFIEDQLAAETTVGPPGVAVRMDIDPQNLGTGPSLDITDVEMFEGNAGTSVAVFDVTLNTTSDSEVVLFWETVDETAVGGASCGPGVDYIADDGSLSFPSGQMTGSINVLVCGDTVIEVTETFRLSLTGVQGGVLARPSATVTVIDDDNVPALRIADVAVIEPAAGSTAEAVFRPVLSKNSDFEARFAFATEPLNAQPGVDFEPVSGTAVIPAGELEAEIPVTILSAPGATPPKSFLLRVSQPFNVTFDDSEALAVINDPAFQRAAIVEQEIVNEQDVIGLAAPTALALSPDGSHAYVTSESLDAVLVFSRNAFNGRLSEAGRYDIGSTGFANALLDGPLDVVVSPDGAHVYIASRNDDAIAVLGRDAGSGALTLVENQVDGVLGAPDAAGPTSGLAGVRRLLISDDGRHLYAAGGNANAVAVFERDPATGGLRFMEAETTGQDDADDAGPAVVAMNRPSGMRLSADGAQLYVASRFGDAVQVFNRSTDPAGADHGLLRFVEAYENGLAGIVGLDGAFDIGVSGDDAHVYVTAEAENAVVLFDRNADGTLSQRTVLRHEVPDRPGLRGAQGLAVSPDGLEVFVAGFGDSSLTLFERMQPGNDAGLPAGDLRVRQTMFDDQGPVLNMAGPTRVTASADDKHLYVVANEDDAIVVLQRISPDVVFFDDFEAP